MHFSRLKPYLIFAGATTIWLLADLISKDIAYQNQNSSIELIKGLFSFTFHKNDGIAFGLFFGKWPQIIISLMVILIIGYIAYRNIEDKKPTINLIFTAMIIGGGLGNLINRIQLGYVVDFIAIRPFPIFNLADVGISVGLILLLLTDLLSKKAK